MSIGRPVPHESAQGHVTGDALYTDDMVRRFPRLLHAWPVCAPHAHALVTGIDIAPALTEAGVAHVLTADDVPGEADSGSTRHDEPLFPGEVMFHLQPVAWVLAETLDAAQRGARRVKVDYTPLPAILSIQQAIEENSFLTAPLRLAEGDLSALDASPVSSRSAGRNTSISKRRRPSPGSTRPVRYRSTPRRSIPPKRRRSLDACSRCRYTRSPSTASAWVAHLAAKKCRRMPGRRLRRSVRGQPGGRFRFD